MRGVSEVIVIILILMITIAITGLAYTFMSSTMASTTSAASSSVSTTTTSMLTSFSIESMDAAKIYVRNIGQSSLSNLSVYVNNDPAIYNISPSVIAAGQVGTVTIYDYLKEGDDITISTTGGFSVTRKAADPCKQAVGCWKFDEGSGLTAYDSSPFGNSGTLVSGPVWTSGLYGSALSFDGSNDYVKWQNVGTDTAAGAKNTVEFWMRWNGVESQMPIGWGGASYDLYFAGGCFGFNTGESNVLGVQSSGLANRWVHVAIVFYNGVPSSSNSEIYLDGVKQQIYSCLGTTASAKSVSQTLYVSGWTDGANYKFGGLIDEIRVYNRAIY